MAGNRYTNKFSKILEELLGNIRENSKLVSGTLTDSEGLVKIAGWGRKTLACEELQYTNGNGPYKSA